MFGSARHRTSLLAVQSMQEDIKSEERREFIELDHRVHVLEVENMALKRTHTLQDNIARQRELKVGRLCAALGKNVSSG